MGYLNPEDQKRCAAKHYADNKDLYKARAMAHNKKTKEAVKAFLAEYLQSHPCVDCGESDSIVLEFDHRDRNTKEFNIGDAVRRRYSLTRTKKEVEKCDVRCANCHRRKTYFENNNPGFIPQTQQI
jgi:hypothetical protein